MPLPSCHEMNATRLRPNYYNKTLALIPELRIEHTKRDRNFFTFIVEGAELVLIFLYPTSEYSYIRLCISQKKLGKVEHETLWALATAFPRNLAPGNFRTYV